MKDAFWTDSLGTRINTAARLAAQLHLKLDQQENSPRKAQAMIGGTDRRVTDDPSLLSVVSSPLPVVEEQPDD
jgi:hypothetical protein